MEFCEFIAHVNPDEQIRLSFISKCGSEASNRTSKHIRKFMDQNRARVIRALMFPNRSCEYLKVDTYL
jgi:hypothetical protein